MYCIMKTVNTIHLKKSLFHTGQIIVIPSSISPIWKEVLSRTFVVNSSVSYFNTLKTGFITFGRYGDDDILQQFISNKRHEEMNGTLLDI